MQSVQRVSVKEYVVLLRQALSVPKARRSFILNQGCPEQWATVWGALHGVLDSPRRVPAAFACRKKQSIALHINVRASVNIWGLGGYNTALASGNAHRAELLYNSRSATDECKL